MVQFLGSPLEIPAAVLATHATRREYVDAADNSLATRIAALEAGAGTGGAGSGGLIIRDVNGPASAFVGDFILADATNGAFTVTLPNIPAVNSLVGVKKVDDT